MEEKKNAADIIEVAKEIETDKNEDLVVKFTRSYEFEGEIIKEVDLSGMDDLSANDMIKANKILNASGNATVLPEMSLEYALVMASFATGKPVEFFKALRPKDAIKVKNRVTSFFFGEE